MAGDGSDECYAACGKKDCCIGAVGGVDGVDDLRVGSAAEFSGWSAEE